GRGKQARPRVYCRDCNADDRICPRLVRATPSVFADSPPGLAVRYYDGGRRYRASRRINLDGDNGGPRSGETNEVHRATGRKGSPDFPKGALTRPATRLL